MLEKRGEKEDKDHHRVHHSYHCPLNRDLLKQTLLEVDDDDEMMMVMMMMMIVMTSDDDDVDDDDDF